MQAHIMHILKKNFLLAFFNVFNVLIIKANV